MLRFGAILVMVVLGAAASVGAPAGDAPDVAEREPPRSVVLLLADTLRADHMSLYGYERETTPALASRARTGTIFERTRSQTACTPTSVASLLTSRYPSDFARPGFGIPDGIPSLAEMLAEAGFRTIALSASSIVRNTPSQYNQDGGFGRGFDVFDEECEGHGATCLHGRALHHLEKGDGRFFLYLHYMDVHHPYRPPGEHERRFAVADLSSEPQWLRDGNPDPIERLLRGQAQEGDAEARLEQVPLLMDLYDDEIAALDAEIDRFLRKLDERGLLASSIVILASDHGEMFLEQNDLKHCRGLWDTVTRTPLVVWIPGVAGGRRVSLAVENLDLVPTILDYLGLSEPGLEGESLRPLIEGTAPADRTGLAFSAQSGLRSVDDGRFKLILETDTKVAHLYDLADDRFERSDVSAEHPAVRDRLRAALDAWLTDEGEQAGDAGTAKRTDPVEDRLRALGYLQ